MIWKKIANRCWQAQGKRGVFTIEQSGKLFWARYCSVKGFKSFKMPPKQKLSEAKEMCQDNANWEDDKGGGK